MVAIRYVRIPNLMEVNRKASANVGQQIGSMNFCALQLIAEWRKKTPWSTWNVVRANAIIRFKKIRFRLTHSIHPYDSYGPIFKFQSLSLAVLPSVCVLCSAVCIPHRQAMNVYPLFSCRRISTIKIEIVLRNTIECVCVHGTQQYRFVCCAYTR